MLSLFDTWRSEILASNPNFRGKIEASGTFLNVDRPSDESIFENFMTVSRDILPVPLAVLLEQGTTILAGKCLLTLLAGKKTELFTVYTSMDHVSIGLLLAKYGFSSRSTGSSMLFTRFAPESEHVVATSQEYLEHCQAATRVRSANLHINGLSRNMNPNEESILGNEKETLKFVEWRTKEVLGDKIKDDSVSTWKMLSAEELESLSATESPKTLTSFSVTFVQDPYTFVHDQLPTTVEKTTASIDDRKLVFSSWNIDHLRAGKIAYDFTKDFVTCNEVDEIETTEEDFRKLGFSWTPGSILTITWIGVRETPTNLPPFAALVASLLANNAEKNLRMIREALDGVENQEIVVAPNWAMARQGNISKESFPYLVLNRNPKGPGYARVEPHAYSGHVTSFNFTHDRSLAFMLSPELANHAAIDYQRERTIAYLILEGAEDVLKSDTRINYSPNAIILALEEIVPDHVIEAAKELIKIPKFELAFFGLEH